MASVRRRASDRHGGCRRRTAAALAGAVLAVVALSSLLVSPAMAAARSASVTRPMHACIGRKGYIRVAQRCAPTESAIGLEIVPLARTAASRPASNQIRPHSITGRQVKVGSLPGSDITPGTLPASALRRGSIGAGLALRGGVLDVNPLLLSPFQKRVVGTCGVGQAIRVINADGTVACQAAGASGAGGTVTSLSQGIGIALSPNPLVSTGTISANLSVVQARLTGTPCTSGQAIADVAQSGAATCVAPTPGGAAGGDLTGTYPSPSIAAGAVTSGDLHFAMCSADFGVFFTLGQGLVGCTGTTGAAKSHTLAGVYCLSLPGFPSGGAVSIDAAASGFPVAYMTTDHSVASGACGNNPAFNVLVETFDKAGGTLTDEPWYGFFF